MKDNPFKFGTVVDGVHFTDREEEIAFISSHLRSENHLIMISPRRFGKTSLIRKILKESDRKHIYLDLQIVLSEEDFASQLLRRVYRIFPYYTQQLAFMVWEMIKRSGYSAEIAEAAADMIVTSHDKDFELLWNTLNRTDMMVLAGMSAGDLSPLSEEFGRLYGTGAVSTVYSSLQRLVRKGMVIKENTAYYIDDPFFRRWLKARRDV